MPSYQEIETRLIVVEEKLDFFMRNFKVSTKNKLTEEWVAKDMLELYHEAKQIQKFEAR